MSGKVILVGAGPGDPGLLTCKGAEVLRQADVVVYDRLVGSQVLELIPAHAERIDVGKQSANHTVPQWRINEILAEKAKEGKTVVRLKGGDPFLFGRGGEELTLLAQEGIAFEEVPGVTSAIAAAAYGGIPVTHRDYTSSLHIITGHVKAGTKLNINFKALVQAKGTYVFLMGVAALELICEGLLDAGMDRNTPAAVVEHGTLPSQRKVISTLALLPSNARSAKLGSPAVIIVGQVAALSEQFDWFSKLPLFGKKVIVTRPKDRSGTLSKRLREMGADVMEYPCIETVPICPCPALDDALEQMHTYGWMAFTSSAGVDVFFNALWQSGRDSRALSGIKFAAIGPSTARALERWHIRPDFMPEVYDTEHLAKGLTVRSYGPVLLPRAAMGSPVLPKVLEESGVKFKDLPIYDTVYRSEQAEEAAAMMETGNVLVTFTSASTVRGFVQSLPGADYSRMTGLCIGPQTAEEAKKYGIPVKIAAEATIDALIELFEQSTEE